ncbi:MAG: hypothetical protein ABW061_02160 [Polyangiaceae bacterium]
MARADIAPPDVTCDTKGAVCDNAAPNGFGPGVCISGVPTTAFGRPSCGPAGEAGAAGAPATECLFCKAAGGSGGGGTAGAGNAAGASAAGAASVAGAPSASTAGATGTPTSTGNGDSDGGCTVRQLGSERGIALFMVGLGVAALALGRRRR